MKGFLLLCWPVAGVFLALYSFHVVEGLPTGGSRKIPSSGGEPIPFTDFPTEHPQWSPDGRRIVFDADTGASIKMIAAEGGEPFGILPDSIRIRSGGLPCWSPSGSHIAFKDGAALSLWLYDMHTGAVERIFHQEGLVPIPGCWSRDGKSILIALMDKATRVSTMWSISADGRERRQITGHRDGFYRYLALSPDGSLLVYGALEGKKVGLWIMPAEGGASIPLAVSPEYHNQCPAWSPDGTRLAYASGRTGRGDIYIMKPDIAAIKEALGLSAR